MYSTAEDVPVQVEDRLPAALADIDDDAIVLEPGVARGVPDEIEHPLRLVGRKLADLAKGRHVAFRDHEEMRVGARVDVPDGDEAVAFADVITLTDEVAEEAVVRQRGSPPR